MKFRLTSSHHPSRQFSERDLGTAHFVLGRRLHRDTDGQPLAGGTATGGGATLLARPSGIQRGKTEA